MKTDDWLIDDGARVQDDRVLDFGDAAAELAALTDGAGVADAGGRDRLVIDGPDAEGFLDRLLTTGVKIMAVGGGSRAFMLDAKGRVVLAFHLYRTDAHRFLVDAIAGHGDDVAARLDMFHFGEQLTIEPATLSGLTLDGPKAAAVLAAAGLPAPDGEGAHEAADDVRVARRDTTGAPGFALFCAPDARADLWRRLRAAGARPVGATVREARRLTAGVPDFPGEYGPHATPLDTGTMDGVTEGKGCYPGQEVIERTLALGRPARTLVRLTLDRPADAGVDLLAADGKGVGTLTSVVPGPAGVVGLGLIKRRAAAKGGPWTAGDATATATESEGAS